MMRGITIFFGWALLGLAWADAQRPMLFFDRERFLSLTGAERATEPYQTQYRPTEPFVSGSIAFNAIYPSTLYFDNWAADFADDNDVELAINENENLDMEHIGGSIYAMGFEFDDATGGREDSHFSISLLNETHIVGSVTFTSESLVGHKFLGLLSAKPFNKLQLREQTGANENEFIGAVYVSPRTPHRGWNKLAAGSGIAVSRFGSAVALDAGHALVSAVMQGQAGLVGKVFSYRRDDSGRWQQTPSLNPFSEASESFGQALSINGLSALVGASRQNVTGNDADRPTGSSFVFKRDEQSWRLHQKLIADDVVPGDYFGYAVSLGADLALVGAPLTDSGAKDTGAVHVFRLDADQQWQQSAKLIADDAQAGDLFGSAIALSSSTAVVGAYGDDDQGLSAGAAYIFELRSGSWIQVAKLVAPHGKAGDELARRVALDEHTVALGAHRTDLNGADSGAVLIYQRSSAGNWQHAARLTAEDSAANDLFGLSIALDGDQLLVGAANDDDYGSASGAAYLFSRDLNGSWQQVDKFSAFDGVAADRFGQSVALDRGLGLISAPFDGDDRGSIGSVYVLDSVARQSASRTPSIQPIAVREPSDAQ